MTCLRLSCVELLFEAGQRTRPATRRSQHDHLVSETGLDQREVRSPAAIGPHLEADEAVDAGMVLGFMHDHGEFNSVGWIDTAHLAAHPVPPTARIEQDELPR